MGPKLVKHGWILLMWFHMYLQSGVTKINLASTSSIWNEADIHSTNAFELFWRMRGKMGAGASALSWMRG